LALDEVQSEKPEDLVAEVKKRVEAGAGFVVADVEPKTLLAMADAIKGRDALILNAGSADDQLREENCRANIKHAAPTRTMLADALAQYMAWKRTARPAASRLISKYQLVA
jgi:ABC transporter substrate binding protein (PQQ-dependent alcohol dehydrogenase system)